jgi:prepilin-type N-terminal cleavage/methylation domain-containing protein/prepilin-type processing-associated H-X9-DG protein
MQAHTGKRGFTLIELLVVIAVIAVLASILFPVFAKAQAKARQTTCTSNLRQLAVAATMFAQDNKSYPDAGTWVGDLLDYCNNNPKMVNCPMDENGEGYVSYNYNGDLVSADGRGVPSGSVFNATEVALLVDGRSAKNPDGKVINFAALEGGLVTRHDGFNMSFADGHAESYGKKVSTVTTDATSPYARAFFFATAYGWVRNPGAGVVPPASVTATEDFTWGGSATCEPIMEAAVQGWAAKGGFEPSSMTGAEGSGNGANAGIDVGASSSTSKPWSGGSWANASCIATDAVGVIVSATSKLGLTAVSRDDCRKLFMDGVRPSGTGKLNVYCRTSDSGTYSFFYGAIMSGAEKYATSVISVSSAREMITKVAGDPYGIGYAGLGEADPAKVTVLNLTVAAGTQKYSRAGVDATDATSASGWLLQRPLFAKDNTAGANPAAGAFMSYLTGSTFQKSILFTTSFFKPKAQASYPSSFATW